MNAPILSSMRINLPTAPASSRPSCCRSPAPIPTRPAAPSIASRSPPPMWWPMRAPPTIPGSIARSIGTDHRYREYLWDLGLGVAEAMDTAQRGMGLDWPTSLELIRRAAGRQSLGGAQRPPALIASRLRHRSSRCPRSVRSIDDVIRAYEEQMAAIEGAGGRLIVMASRALARVAKSPADYERVYDRVLAQAKEPVIIHWLGEMFDPALAGYWGSSRPRCAAMETAVGIIKRHAAKVDGIKISLLDKDKEIAMRRRLPAGVRMYTGDDFNYAELIAGDEQGYSDALLGIFDAIAPAASAALAALAAGDRNASTQSWSRPSRCRATSSRRPTRFYKTGVVFMAYLNGLQDHFVMVGGQQSARSIPHLAELFRLADRAGLLRDPGHGAPAHGARAGRARDCLMRDFSRGVAHLSINTATLRKQLRRCRHHRGVRPSRHPQHLPLARSGRAAGLAKSRGSCKRAGIRCRATAAAGSLLPPMPRACAPRSTTTGARSTRPRPSARLAWCWWWAHCRGRWPAAAHKDIGLARAQVVDGIAATLDYARRRHAARHRAAAPHAGGRPRLRQHAGAGARHLRRTRPGRTARWASPSTSITSGGIPSSRARSRGRAANDCWPTTSAIGCCRRAICSTIAA